VENYFPCQNPCFEYHIDINHACDEGSLCHQGKELTSLSISIYASLSASGSINMPEKMHVVTIVINDVEAAYHPITELLHGYAGKIKLRVGYPMQDKNVSVIFLVMEMNLDEMGAFSGKLGQLKSVKVKSITLKI
jgi:putative iron-only hydrogenase system regulator